MTPWQGIIAAFVYTAYLLIVTLYPFEFTSDFQEKLEAFQASFLSTFPTHVDQLAMSNLIKKFILSVPLGIFLYYPVNTLKRTKLTTIFLACIFGLLINFFYELCQAFYAARHASAVDLLSKTVGAFCGTLISAFCLTRVPEPAKRVWRKAELAEVALFLAFIWAIFPGVAFALQYPWFTFRNWDPRFSLQMGNEATSDKPWLGKIYLAALYNRELPADEIARHFRRGFSSAGQTSVKREGLVALYAFNDGAGHTVRDTSGFGRPLDLTVSPGSHFRWLPDSNGIEIFQPATVSSHGPATKLFTALTATSELSVEVWITPANITQTGSARIISFSRDWWSCNFMLAQMHANIVFRVRTPLSGGEGGAVYILTNDHFLTTDRIHLVVTYKDGLQRLYVNGREHIDPVDMAADTMVGFSVKKSPTAKIAYSFFYFFPLASCLAGALSTQRQGSIATCLLPVAIGAGLLSMTEIFHAVAFERPLDLPLLGYGVLTATVGALTGIAWVDGRPKVAVAKKHT
jgi:VanZ family protein